MGRCDEGQLDEAEKRIGRHLPAPLRSLYLAANGVFNIEGQWWVVWTLDRLIEENLAAPHDRTLDKFLIAFGDDGTGDPFCMRVGDDSRVARWSYIDMAVVEEMSFGEFEEKWMPR